MMDKTGESKFFEILNRRASGEISFADFLEELVKIGIYEYEIDVATGQATYKGGETEIKTDPQINVMVSEKFDRNKVLAAIANISIPFLDFLQELADAGIKSYSVFIPTKKVEYISINGEVIVDKLKL